MKSYIYTKIAKRKFQHFGKKSFIFSPCIARNRNCIYIGDSVIIREHCWINVTDTRKDNRASLIIEDGTYFGRFCQINAYNDVVIGKNVLIADNVYISDVDHEYRNIESPVMCQGITKSRPIKICDGGWIGKNVVILPGVTIGKNSVVGANSVVTKSVPDYSVAIGIPAIVVKTLI